MARRGFYRCVGSAVKRKGKMVWEQLAAAGAWRGGRGWAHHEKIFAVGGVRERGGLDGAHA